MNIKKLLIIGSILGALGVSIGAMGAHALKPLLSSDQLSWISKGTQYQFVHVIMIFVSVVLYKLFDQKLYITAAWFLVVGVLFFSGSLYLLATRELIGLSSWKWLGPITPIGGLCFIIGWILLMLASMKSDI